LLLPIPRILASTRTPSLRPSQPMTGNRTGASLLALQGASSWRTMTLDERVRCRRAIEHVYWKRRRWEASTPKPSFDSLFSQQQLRALVEDELRQQHALDLLWRHAPTPAELHAEVSRMIRHSKQPEVLRELFAALGHDPIAIAECLARPALIKQRLRADYARDRRFHTQIEAQARRALEAAPTFAGLSRLGAICTEVEFIRSDRPEAFAPARANRLVVSSADWEAELDQLAERFGSSLKNGSAKLMPGLVTPLCEDDERFFVQQLQAIEGGRVRLATAEWHKVDFDTWWAQVRTMYSPVILAVSGSFPEIRLPVAAEPVAAESDLPKAFAGNDNRWAQDAGDGVPAARFRHTAVWTGVEMIVWGGFRGAFSGGSPLNTGGRYNPVTDTWTPTRVAPSAIGATDAAPAPRVNHTAVWTGTRMIIWGGVSGAPVNSGALYDPVEDKWTATRTDPSSPTANDGAPAARFSHVAVWLAQAGRMVIWGGNLNSVGAIPIPTTTGGVYNPETNVWSATATTSAPLARTDHVAVSTGTAMIVFGGVNADGGRLNSGGIYTPSNNTWTATSTTNAPGLFTPSAVWTGTELLVWGSVAGAPAPIVAGARYSPSNNTWTPISTTGAPTPRVNQSTVWTGTEMIIWGGAAFNVRFNDGGRYNPTTNTWTPVTTVGAPPGRENHTAIWTDAYAEPNQGATKYMIVWGGQGGDATGGRYDPVTDTWLPTATTTVPVAREGHTAVNTGVEMIIWGGTTAGVRTLTGGRYNLATAQWAPTSTEGAPGASINLPPVGHTAVWTGNEMIVWGGQTNAGGRYNPVTNNWTPTTLTNAPVAREEHTAVWTGSEMIIWGGRSTDSSNNTTYLDNGGRYNPTTDTWAPTSTEGRPGPRFRHTAVWTGSEMIIWGGATLADNRFSELRTGGRYNPATERWMPTRTDPTSSGGADGAPDARFDHTAVWTGDRMIIWGGATTSAQAFNSGGLYNPDSDTWVATNPNGAPAARSGHTAIWTGREMIVWGDAGATGGRYTPTFNFWRPVETEGAPDLTTGHTAVWDASRRQMVVWGGRGSSGVSNALGAYGVRGEQGDTVGVFRRGQFFLRNSNTSGDADLVVAFGAEGDLPLAGDWNGDGITTVGVFRNGTFFLRNSNDSGVADLAFAYGGAEDIPLVGDWDGDGIITIGVYRPAERTFFLRNSNTAGNPDVVVVYGNEGDRPIVGDWDGNGTTTVGVVRGNTFLLRNANAGGEADLAFNFGNPDDKVVVGDFDGDGVDTVGVYRVLTFFLRNTNLPGTADFLLVYGAEGDLPLVGNWDGQL
ncbi:MAG: Kelch repeat-containing protein, partial [Acidobacteriota bacterium]